MIFDNADSSPFKTATADHEAITFVFSPYGSELYVLDGTSYEIPFGIILNIVHKTWIHEKVYGDTVIFIF